MEILKCFWMIIVTNKTLGDLSRDLCTEKNYRTSGRAVDILYYICVKKKLGSGYKWGEA